MNLRKIWHIWCLLGVSLVQTVLLPETAATALPVLFFAYFQNIAFSLSSRSRQRSSTTYHFIAAIFANLIFFSMLRALIKSELPITLVLPYITGTVAGSITGATVSQKIEKILGAHMDSKVKNAWQGLWPVLVLIGSLFVSPILFPGLSPSFLVFVFGLLLIDSFSHTLLSRAGNRDKTSLVMGTALFKGFITFLIYQQLVSLNMEWSLFIPYTAGGISGSLIGVYIASHIEWKTNAKADTHVEEEQIYETHGRFISFLLLLFGGATFISDNESALLFIFLLATLQNFSFLIVSRAKNRDNVLYHSLASIFSNGVWFLTLRQLVLGDLRWELMIPYASGVAMGSVLAHYASMRIEQKIGARADGAPAKAV